MHWKFPKFLFILVAQKEKRLRHLRAEDVSERKLGDQIEALERKDRSDCRNGRLVHV
jgi:hypothetical protein